jgi:hypothetical protein
MVKKIGLLLLIIAAAAGGYYYYSTNSSGLSLPAVVPTPFGSNEPAAESEKAVETPAPILGFVNQNGLSPAYVAISERGEGLVAHATGAGPEPTVTQVVFKDAQDRIGQIKTDDTGRPVRLEYDEHVIEYVNYQAATVDLQVTKPNGIVQLFAEVPLPEAGLLPADAVEADSLSWLVRPAQAAAVSQYYPHTLGQIINTTFCTAGAVIATVGSGGVGAPLLVSCGTLITRGVTGVTGYNECEGDIVQCSTDALWETLEAHGPGFLRDGFRVKGRLINSVTGSPVTQGTVLSRTLAGEDGPRGEWLTDGRFDIYFNQYDTYTVRFGAEGFADAAFDVVVGDEQSAVFLEGDDKGIRIRHPASLVGQTYGEHEMIFGLTPDGWLRGEVIELEGGMPLPDATVRLYDGETLIGQDATDEEGRFWLEPEITKRGPGLYRLTAAAPEYITAEVWPELTYEIVPESDSYEYRQWDGMIRLRPGIEVWELKGDYQDGCYNMGSLYLKLDDGNPRTMLFGGWCEDPKGCDYFEIDGQAQAPGNLDFGVEGFLGGVTYQIKGTLGEKTGSGQLIKPRPPNVSRGELHHYESCDTTWTAEKVIK